MTKEQKNEATRVGTGKNDRKKTQWEKKNENKSNNTAEEARQRRQTEQVAVGVRGTDWQAAFIHAFRASEDLSRCRGEIACQDGSVTGVLVRRPVVLDGAA